MADVERLARRGPLDRLFGRGGLRETDLGRGRRLIELSPRSARPLVPAFKSYVRRAVGTAWPSTTSILGYLDIAFELFIRGEREGEYPAEWYVQLSFGGCAGLAETSSEVAAHWASKWWAAERETIASLLVPRGFTPTRVTKTGDELTFLPVNDLGYVSFLKDGYAVDAETPPTHFELDASVDEIDEEGANELRRALERDWVGYMADGRCHCQLCDPAFDQAILANLPLELGGE
jgi:hypothetical protein